jgi:hypothetical protein
MTIAYIAIILIWATIVTVLTFSTFSVLRRGPKRVEAKRVEAKRGADTPKPVEPTAAMAARANR